MADDNRTLVLHLRTGSEPLLFAVPADDASALEQRLPQLIKNGAVETVHTGDGPKVTVNFAHVAIAFLDDPNRKSKVFGMR